MGTVGEPAQGAAAVVIQALQEVDDECNSECIPISNSSSSDSIVGNASASASISESLCRTEEVAWIRHRLARKRLATREAEVLRLQQQLQNRSHDSRADPIRALGTLQLRRLLRAVGLLSEDLARERLQESLAERVREAISTGRLAAFVEEQRAIPKDSFQCVVQMRKTATTVALIENLLAASSAHPSSTSGAAPSSPPPLVESVIIPPGEPWSLPKIARSRTTSTEDVSPPSSPSFHLVTTSSSSSNEDFVDSPYTPDTLPATPPPETPSTTGGGSTVVKRILPKSSLRRECSLTLEAKEDALASSSFRDDAAGGMRYGRGHTKWTLPFAKKLMDRAGAADSPSGRDEFSSGEKGGFSPGKKGGRSPGKKGGASGKKGGGSPGKRGSFTTGRKAGFSPGDERHKTRVASPSKWCRVVGRGWVLREAATDVGGEAAHAQTTGAMAPTVLKTTTSTTMTTTVTPTQGVPRPAAAAASSSPSTSIVSAAIPQTPSKDATAAPSTVAAASPNPDTKSSSKEPTADPPIQVKIDESPSKPAGVDEGSATGVNKSIANNVTAGVITTKSSPRCQPSSPSMKPNTARWGPPNAAPLLRKRMAAMALEKQKKSSQQVDRAVNVQSTSSKSTSSDGGYAGEICVPSKRNKGVQQDKPRPGRVTPENVGEMKTADGAHSARGNEQMKSTSVTRTMNSKIPRCGKTAAPSTTKTATSTTLSLKSGVSAQSGIPPPVPPRPRAPPVPPRPGASRIMSPPFTASNPLLPRAGGGTAVSQPSVVAPTVTWNSNISGSSSSNYRPLLASGGPLKSGGIRPGPRPILSGGGVGVNRSGMTRAVSPSRLPAAIDYDDDSGSDSPEGVSSIPSNTRGEPARSKVLMPSAAAMMNSSNFQMQQQKQMASPKPFKAKDIEVIFDDHDDNDDHKDGGGSGKGYNSDSEGDDKCIRDESDSEEENDPVLKILEPLVTPEWAEPEAVKAALERQYGREKPINPSTIFVDFYTCNLESIFDTKKKKWERKSTGDWMTDRLTIAEKMAYDRAMGYVSISNHSTSKGKGSDGTA